MLAARVYLRLTLALWQVQRNTVIVARAIDFARRGPWTVAQPQPARAVADVVDSVRAPKFYVKGCWDHVSGEPSSRSLKLSIHSHGWSLS